MAALFRRLQKSPRWHIFVWVCVCDSMFACWDLYFVQTNSLVYFHSDINLFLEEIFGKNLTDEDRTFVVCPSRIFDNWRQTCDPKRNENQLGTYVMRSPTGRQLLSACTLSCRWYHHPQPTINSFSSSLVLAKTHTLTEQQHVSGWLWIYLCCVSKTYVQLHPLVDGTNRRRSASIYIVFAAATVCSCSAISKIGCTHVDHVWNWLQNDVHRIFCVCQKRKLSVDKSKARTHKYCTHISGERF